MRFHRSLLAVAVPHATAASAAAQGDTSAVVVVRAGGDTIAVERATVSARRAEGSMRRRTPPTLVRLSSMRVRREVLGALVDRVARTL